MTQARVAVILVNWNNHVDTLECLRSLMLSSHESRDVIVVDNGSRPESVAALLGAAGCDLMIESAHNLGFTGGNNLGIRAALIRGADFVFVLNNDTTVDRDTIAVLVDAMEGSPEAAIATPKIRFYDPENLIWYGGARFSPASQNPVMLGYLQTDDGRWDTAGDVPFASGCAMLIRGDVLDRLGGFDDKYFAVFEDAELSLRVRGAGYRIMYVPSALVWHKESASVGGHDAPGYVYYQVRNRILFLRRKPLATLSRISGLCFALAYFMKQSVRFATRARWTTLAAMGAAVVDGAAGRGGARGSHG
jgi:GT2 family glycosyltransferase